ncbi:MAG: PD-(D/E)XK nuclease family protein [Opitutaceae bacterium]
MSRTSVQLDWNLPLLPAITERLLNFSDGDSVDLTAYMVIVPTKQAGRRLLESLALAVTKDDRGLFPPEIITPDQILSRVTKHLELASEDCSTAAWFNTLSGINYENFKALFPVEPITSTGWKLGMAQRLMQLRSELGEEGLDFEAASKLASEAGIESERWYQLALLEGLVINELKQRGLTDPKQARRAAADSYEAPDHIERIILAATPDPQALPLRALIRYAAENPIEVWTYGPSHLFDEWGRPLQTIWSERPLDLEAWSCHLKTAANPKSVAVRVAELLNQQVPEAALIGLADPNLNPIVAEAMSRAGIASYDPEGSPLRNTRPGRLTEQLCTFATDDSTPTLRSLLQHPDIAKWLGTPEEPVDQLRQLDRLFEAHLAPDLASCLYFAKQSTRYARLVPCLERLQQLVRNLKHSADFAGVLADTLQTIYSAQKDTPESKETIPWKDSTDAIRQQLEASQETREYFRKLPSDYSREAFRMGLNRLKVYPDRPKAAHDLLGWLELLWNDAPQLILAGMNESIVPESVTGDAFLPESLREVFGLRTNDQRFARDAYLLEALCRRRSEAGRIDVLIPQTAADGTPLKPSRILFQCEPNKLLQRTRRCFATPEDSDSGSDHSIAWKLSPPKDLPLPSTLSVSALKSYLECPFRFFLRHILKLRTLDVETRELTPASFGTLFHDAVAELTTADLENATEDSLFKTTNEIAEATLKKQYGSKLSFALRLQREALIARLSAFSKHQVENLQDRGRTEILNTESKFELPLNGIVIRGVIDRTDQRGERIELIDYKTADSPKTPEQAHLKTVAKKDPPKHLPEEAFFEDGSKRYRWIDLQLPLYALSKGSDAGERPNLAYFNLANTVEKSGIEYWENFTDSHLDSAKACATAIIDQIKQGVFWPPNPDVREDYDEFAPLFPDGIENSVEIEAFKDYQFELGADKTE